MNVALVIARKNSKRIPNKNKKNFCGKPIIFWPLNTINKSRIFDKIYLSTDDLSIAKLGKKYGANIPFIRDKKFGGDKISTIRVVKDFIKKISNKEKINIKNLCCVYASAPFFTAKDLKESLKKLINLKSDFSFVVNPIDKVVLRSFCFKKKKISLINKKFRNYRSQDLPDTFIDSGQFYWANKSTWLKKKTIFTDNTSALIKNESLYIDINEKKDWIKAEKIFKKKNKI
jgi:pseudaminic acid cytidylyltransferase